MGELPTFAAVTRLTLIGEVNSLTGYGQHLIHTFRYLQNRGIHVSVRAISQTEQHGAQVPGDIKEHLVHTRQPEEWELLIAPPHHVPTPGRKTVFFTMWESTRFPGPFVENTKKAETVIVPCEWNRECLRSSGVDRPIHIVPLGFDPAVFFKRPMPPELPVVFGAAGRTAHGRDRKGLDGVIRAFRAAFPYDEHVRLRIKCHPDCTLPEFNDKRIEVTRAHLPPARVADWLAGCHAFVSAATAEGWGLWQLQAMAIGRPVIAAVYGGLTEFMNEQNSLPLAYREGNCSENWDGLWALPDLEDMIRRMLAVHSDCLGATELGDIASRSVQHLTWDKSGDKLYYALQRSGALPFPTFCSRDGMRTTSVIEQCNKNGWPVQKLEFETRKDEVIFNPSVVDLPDFGPTWFHRRSTCVGGLDRTESSIFSCCDQPFTPLECRSPIALPGFPDDTFEDPRAIVHDGGVALSYTRVIKGSHPRQEIAFLDRNMKPTGGWCVPFGNNCTRSEKNWVWFNHEGVWHFIHWLEPMRVVRVENGVAVKVYETNFHHKEWRYGVKHGGAPPTRIRDEYWSFCHSLLPWFGRDRSRYYIHAYAFKAAPPFNLTRISLVRLLESEDDVTASPCSCVIVGGAMFDGDTWTLAVGARDEQSLKIKIPHKDVLIRMVDTYE